MATKLGEMTVCKECGAEYIGTAAGQGTVTCCGQPTEPKTKSTAKEEV